MKNRILLAYSGGLDTSAIIPWLKENYAAEVIAYCCNLGNQPDEAELRDRALTLGASDFIFEDTQRDFADSYVIPTLRSGATYFDDYLLGTAIARPLIAERTCFWAKELRADFLAHGATGKGNDHLRFERGWAYLCPEIAVIAPWKTWSFKGRKDLVAYLKSKHFEWENEEKLFSVDINLLHRSCEGGVLEDPSQPYDPSKVFGMSQLRPQQDHTVFRLEFLEGIPIALNGVAMDSHHLISNLNQIGGAHAIGVVDLIEERTNGIKSRGIYETPGGTILFHAYKELKRLCWSRELYFMGQRFSQEYGRLIYDGLWFSDARLSIEGFFESALRNLKGSLEARIEGSNIIWTSRQSPHSLFDADQTSFESDSDELNAASSGFTKFMTASLQRQGRILNRGQHGNS